VVRHKKAESLSWTETGRKFDVLPKLVQQSEALYEQGKLTQEARRRSVSPGQAEFGRMRSELSRLKMDNAILKNSPRIANPLRIGLDRKTQLASGLRHDHAFIDNQLHRLCAVLVRERSLQDI
jgi:transposase-like protein